MNALTRLLVKYGKSIGSVPPSHLSKRLADVRDINVDTRIRLRSFENILNDDQFIGYISKLKIFSDSQQQAKYMLSNIEIIEVLFMNIDSIRTSNWQAYKDSIRLMMPWMVIYDNTNYGRYILFKINLECNVKRFGFFLTVYLVKYSFSIFQILACILVGHGNDG